MSHNLYALRCGTKFSSADRNNYKKTRGQSDDANAFTRLFGSTIPKNIPESAALGIRKTVCFQSLLLKPSMLTHKVV